MSETIRAHEAQSRCRLLHLKGRVIATFVTLFEVTVISGILCYIFVPSVIDETHQLAQMLRDYSSDTNTSVPLIPERLHDYIRNNVNLDRLIDALEGEHFDTIIDKSTTFISESIDFVLHVLEWFLTFVYVIFVLIDYRRSSTI